MSCLWDTDVLSHVFTAKNPHVVRRATAYAVLHPQATFSVSSRYEVLRGFKAKSATARVKQFEAFCQRHQMLSLTDDILDLAADVWAAVRRSGFTIDDNDVLIAATALYHRMPLATGNVAHHGR